jgi:hypothetical protein
MRIKSVMATLAACLLMLQPGGGARAQDAAVLLSSGEIPAEGYDSWSLFLICSPGWLDTNRSADLATLFGRFQAFGEAIGDDHLAVWFWKEDVARGGDASQANVDLRRAAKYCQKLRLDPSRGPYIVVTKEYPDLTDFPENTVYTLGVLDSVAIGDLLDRLTDKLLLPDDASSDSGAGFWIRFLESAQDALAVPCGVTIKVDAAFINAEMSSCPN